MRGSNSWLRRVAGLGLTLALSGFAAAQTTWSQDGPVPRVHPSGVFDPTTDQMIVFGGLPYGTTVPLNDVWGNQQIVANAQVAEPNLDWTPVVPTGTAPAGRSGHSAIYDSNSGNMIVFAGAGATACLNDLWTLEDANSSMGIPNWFELTASGTIPPARAQQSAVYDATKNILIVFGGTNCAGGYFSDVWTLSNANGTGGTPTWTQLSPSGTAPAARENSSAIYDSTNHVLTIYAGDAGGAGMSDVWTLSNANGQNGTPTWTQLSPTGAKAPPARTGQSGVYDTVDNRMIIFGGITTLTGTGYLGDTWILTYPNNIGGTPAWIALKVTGTAPLRRFHDAFYDSQYNDMLIFGGDSQIMPISADDRTFVLTEANGLK
jgi:hypothetical protein